MKNHRHLLVYPCVDVSSTLASLYSGCRNVASTSHISTKDRWAGIFQTIAHSRTNFQETSLCTTWMSLQDQPWVVQSKITISPWLECCNLFHIKKVTSTTSSTIALSNSEPQSRFSDISKCDKSTSWKHEKCFSQPEIQWCSGSYEQTLTVPTELLQVSRTIIVVLRNLHIRSINHCTECSSDLCSLFFKTVLRQKNDPNCLRSKLCTVHYKCPPQENRSYVFTASIVFLTKPLPWHFTSQGNVKPSLPLRSSLHISRWLFVEHFWQQ